MDSRYKIWLFILIVVSSARPTLAQYQLSGRVFEATDTSSIVGAEVFLLTKSISKFTSKNGRFEFLNVESGSYDILVFKEGYQTFQQTITLDDQPQSLNIPLSKIVVDLSAVVIQSEAEKVYGLKRLRAVEGTAIYAGKKTEVVLLDNLTANLAANNARQIYGQVAGLNIFEAEDAGLQLSIGGRGLDPNRTANFNTRQNGYDISADVLGYPESYYSPPAEALREIRLVRGAASLQYGTQFGGLVDFIFKKPNPNRKVELVSRQTIGSNGLFTSFNSLSGTVKKFSYFTFFNYKRGDSFRPNSNFESFNFFGHIGYQLSTKTNVTLEYTFLDYLAQQPGGLTDAQFIQDPSFSNRTRNWFKVNWKLLAFKFNHKFSPKTDLSVTLFGLDASRDAIGFRTNRVSQTDDFEAPRDLLKGTFLNGGIESRLLHRYQIGKKDAIFLIGAKLYQSKNTALQGPGTTASDASFTLASVDFPFYPNQSDFEFPNFNLALFGEHIFYLSPKLSITPGVRLEHIRTESKGLFRKIDFDLAGNPIRDQIFPDDRSFERTFLLLGVGASYKPQENLEFYGNFSQNYRSVTFNDIRIVNPSFQVDPNITDESGFTADFGFRGRTNKFSFDISGFGLLYDDRLGEVLRAETRTTAEGTVVETGRVVRFRGNIGQGFIYGLESLIDYNFLNGQNRKSQAYRVNGFVNIALTGSEYLESEIPGVEGNQVEFIPTVNLKTGLRFGYHNFLGSLQYTFLSEQFTDASNAPQDLRDNQSGIVGSIPTYDILDLSLSYNWGRFKFESGINNLLDNAYFTRRATGYPGPGIIPAAPRTYYGTIQFRW